MQYARSATLCLVQSANPQAKLWIFRQTRLVFAVHPSCRGVASRQSWTPPRTASLVGRSRGKRHAGHCAGGQLPLGTRRKHPFHLSREVVLSPCLRETKCHHIWAKKKKTTTMDACRDIADRIGGHVVDCSFRVSLEKRKTNAHHASQVEELAEFSEGRY